MYPRGEDRGMGARPPSVLRRIGRAAFSPWRLLRVEESMAAIRRDFHDLGAGGRAGASRMRADETGVFEVDASGFLHGQRRAAVDGSQRLDLSRARRAVISWLALPAHDNDLDRQCDADRVAVHAGLRGLLSAGVPVRARELPDPNASQGHGDRIPQRAALLLATLTQPSTERLRKWEGRRRWSAALPYGAKEPAADPPLARVHRK